MSDLEVVYTLGAQKEIEDSFLWIKERAPRAADKWREELSAKSKDSLPTRSIIQSHLKTRSSQRRSG